jgi:hypothetical protein
LWEGVEMIINVFVNTALIAVAFIVGSVFGVVVGWLCGCGYGFVYGLWNSRKNDTPRG